METSDSENFESADEDFSSSDCEDDRKKSEQLVGQNIRPNVCQLKDDERTKNIIHGSKKEIKEVGSVINDESPSSSEDTSEHLSIVNKKCDNKNSSEISEKVVNEKKTKVHLEKTTEIIENDNENVGRTIIATEFVENISPVSKSKENNNKNSKSESDGGKTELQPELIHVDSKTEDNLWNDDEIDWESEAVKEESQKTEDKSPNSKKEDSGWDDFDVDWESETPISSEKNTKSKTEHVDLILKPTLAEDIKKSNILSQDKPEDNLWEEDDWEPLEKPEDKPKQPEEQSGWGGWGSWDVSSLLNTATQGVSSLTNHMSQGLSTVLESGIGIPDPEELAKINKLEKESKQSKQPITGDMKQMSDGSPGFGLDNLVSGMSQLTKFVESTGTKVITGGLDTLEAIGKKTVEVLQDGDPGLKKKRAFLKLDPGKPNLSQMLREAKERAEEENKDHQHSTQVKRVKNYEALFDDHQGLVHLEALEMLSRLCSIKLSNLNNSLTGDALKDMQETLQQVKELCELPEDDEEEKLSLEEAKEIIKSAVKEIGIPISYDKLVATYENSDTWLATINLDFIDDTELHQQGIETLAQLTAFAVEQFHKTGELLMVKDHRSTADEADSLVQITTTVKSLIVGQAGKFSDKLSLVQNANRDNISEHITNIFYEAANSGTYIQDAFQLLIPVLQVGAV